MADENSSFWYGYSPIEGPGFIAPEGTELFWCRIDREPYDQDRLPKMERVTTATAYPFPVPGETPDILDIQASWFEGGLPDERTPFLLWVNVKHNFYKAVPLAYWVGYHYGGWLSACYHKNKRPKLWVKYTCDIPFSKFEGSVQGYIVVQKGKHVLTLCDLPQSNSFCFEGPKVKDLKSIQVWVSYSKDLDEDSSDIPELKDFHERLLATNLREVK